MSNIESQSREPEWRTNSENDLAASGPPAAKVGDVLSLRMSGTMYGQVTEQTGPGVVTVEVASCKIVMTSGDGPGEWRELNPGAATGDVITGHNLRQYEEDQAD
jgi:hypothetical protein